MNQGLSHYVNASGTNWDTLIPQYLMAYRTTPHGSTGYSPYYLLHGREMVLPTTQDIKAQISPKVTGTDYEGKLENLKASLNLAYRIVRRDIRKANAKNRQYYDRKAKERSFRVNDLVYLFNPARKRGQSSKFQFPWTVPYRILAKLSDLHYRIANTQGREFTVHVNWLKRAYNQYTWEKTREKGSVRKTRGRRQPNPEEKQEIRAPGPITVPRVGNGPPTPQTPNRYSPRRLDTPSALQTDPGSERTDPEYVPPDTHRSRRELSTSRFQPPLTRLDSRLQPLYEEQWEIGN
jgi:hypothetical protein